MEKPKISRYDRFKEFLSKNSAGKRAKYLGIAAVCGGLSLGAYHHFNDLIQYQGRINSGIRNLNATGEYIERVVVSDNVGTQELSNIANMVIESNVKRAYPIANQLEFIQQIYTPGNKKEQEAVKLNLLKMKSSLDNLDNDSSTVAFFGTLALDDVSSLWNRYFKGFIQVCI